MGGGGGEGEIWGMLTKLKLIIKLWKLQNVIFSFYFKGK